MKTKLCIISNKKQKVKRLLVQRQKRENLVFAYKKGAKKYANTIAGLPSFYGVIP
jgi:hypothetical protein